MFVEREECCPEDHKQRNNLSLFPLSFLLAETDGLESDWITSGFLWDLFPAVCFQYYAHTHLNLLTHTQEETAISSVS